MRLGETHRFWMLLLFPLVVWASIAVQLMIVDVWDETRGMQLVTGHSALELIASNWMQTTVGGTVLFRPLPFLVFTLAASVIGDQEVLWRVLRILNAVTVLASVVVLVGALRRWRGPDLARDGAFAFLLLFSGSAMITIGWFANIFDASVLFLIALALWFLSAERPTAAGLALGVSFFCKEIAVLGLLLGLLLGWLGIVPWRQVWRASRIAVPLFLVFVACRVCLVPPGSGADVHGFSASGLFDGLLVFPETFLWQRADVAMPWVGTLVLIGVLALAGSLRAVGAAVMVILTAALIYGPMVHLGEHSLIDPDNFAGRLYLVPAALVFFLLALSGRRLAIVLALPLVLWGGAATALHHARFQAAYDRLYSTVAASQEGAADPVRVDCALYANDFRDERHGVWLGVFPDAGWRFETDGRVVRTDRETLDRGAGRLR